MKKNHRAEVHPTYLQYTDAADLRCSEEGKISLVSSSLLHINFGRLFNFLG